jgi:hypothetical protein
LGGRKGCECESEHENGQGEAKPMKLTDIGGDKPPRRDYFSTIPRQRCDHACSESEGFFEGKRNEMRSYAVSQTLVHGTSCAVPTYFDSWGDAIIPFLLGW